MRKERQTIREILVLPVFLGVLASRVKIIKQVGSHLVSKSIDMVSDCDSLGDVIIARSRVSGVEVDRQLFRRPERLNSFALARQTRN